MMKRSGNKGRKFNRYVTATCIRCGCEYNKMIIDNECMCQDCKIQDTVDRMTRRIKFQ